jgi:hypothetical protein
MVQKRNNAPLKKKNVLQNLIPHSKLGWALTLAPMILGAFGGLGVVAEELDAAGGGSGGGGGGGNALSKVVGASGGGGNALSKVVGASGGGGGGAVAEDPLEKLATLASLKTPLEKQAAVGGFTMGKAPPVRPFRKEFQVAFQQFKSSKQKNAKDYHQKVVRIVRKKFPGNLKAQLDYLEENGFAEFNPTTTCGQITTREQATQKIQQVNARICAIDKRAREYMKAHPDMLEESQRNRHRSEAQRKIEKFLKQTKGRVLTEEEQATYEFLKKQRELEKEAYKMDKILQRAEGGGGSLQKATGVAEGGLARPPSALGKQVEGGLARPLSKQAEGGGASLAAGGGASGEDPFDEAWYMSSDDDL